MGSFKDDPTISRQKLQPGIVRRIMSYARPYRGLLFLFLSATAMDALLTVVNPLLFRQIIDKGILAHNQRLVITLAVVVAGVAAFDAFLGFAIRWFSARVGQGLVYDLRTQVFDHVQRQPIAFFTRAQTGSLVSRLNTDVIGAQQALTSTLSSVLSNILSLIAILITMFLLSWEITTIALLLIPLFLYPAMLVGKRLQRLTRESMQLDAQMGSTMTERFNVGGAMLVKLFGRPEGESQTFARSAGRVRDIGVVIAMYGQVFFVALVFLASLATAVAYGLGGSMVIHHVFELGTLVALVSLLTRVYAPIANLAGVQISVMTALVSFDRVFEVLDLKPAVVETAGAAALTPAAENGPAPDVEFSNVSFRYPSARDVSLASLEVFEMPGSESSDAAEDVLHGISFRAPSGQLTALVGPSGAGKTTITHLVARLSDPTSGTVRIGGQDIKEVTFASLHAMVGVVTQDAHLFHDTIRANLSYARPGASERDLLEACEAAQISDLLTMLPDGLDTVVGDRGFRLSGGEKQRLALARLLLKAPSVVVLDEATAHLDSESEAAVQRALKTALTGRTSLVIAHRLSTIREADQILVVESGRITESGRHEELLAAGGLYTDLYRTQFARQEPSTERV
jgi:ATP-binding cassette subfamily B protein